jgi:hypothetical protein
MNEIDLPLVLIGPSATSDGRAECNVRIHCVRESFESAGLCDARYGLRGTDADRVGLRHGDTSTAREECGRVGTCSGVHLGGVGCRARGAVTKGPPNLQRISVAVHGAVAAELHAQRGRTDNRGRASYGGGWHILRGVADLMQLARAKVEVDHVAVHGLSFQTRYGSTERHEVLNGLELIVLVLEQHAYPALREVHHPHGVAVLAGIEIASVVSDATGRVAREAESEVVVLAVVAVVGTPATPKIERKCCGDILVDVPAVEVHRIHSVGIAVRICCEGTVTHLGHRQGACKYSNTSALVSEHTHTRAHTHVPSQHGQPMF